jgi:hypothetical protein
MALTRAGEGKNKLKKKGKVMNDEIDVDALGKMVEAVRATGTERSEEEILNVLLREGKRQTERERDKSGFKGVYWVKALKMWEAKFTYGGKTYSVGVFENAEEADETKRRVEKAVKLNPTDSMLVWLRNRVALCRLGKAIDGEENARRIFIDGFSWESSARERLIEFYGLK